MKRKSSTEMAVSSLRVLLNNYTGMDSYEPGKFADMLILGSNPLDDIGNIRDIDLVIQNGRIYERDYFAYKEEDL